MKSDQHVLQNKPDPINQMKHFDYSTEGERIREMSPRQFNKYHTDKMVQQNSKKYLITGLTLLGAQIVICIIHGMFIQPKQQANVAYPQSVYSILAFFSPLAISFASTLGFGLLFSYNKRLLLSGLGFSLFINAYALQYYPLISALWAKAKLFTADAMDSSSTLIFFLSNHGVSASSYQHANRNANNIESCFRAAISINVAISCVLGRVGLFEIFLTLIIGIFGYELNRRICVQNFGDDAFGSMYIFAYGGFMGLAMSILLRYRDRQDLATFRHKFYTANRFSIRLALLGSAILMITLPFLVIGQYKDQAFNQFLHYTPFMCMIFSMSGGLLGGMTVSLIANGRLGARDFIHGPIAGMIMGGVASYFTGNLAYAVGIGYLGGCLQAAIQNTLQKKIARRYRPFSTISFSLFGFMGILAAGTGAIGKKIIEGNSTWLPYATSSYNASKLIIFGLISSGIGLGFGLILGIIFYFANISPRNAYFNDTYNWRKGQDIDQDLQQSIIQPQVPIVVQPSIQRQSVSTLQFDPDDIQYLY